VSITCELLGGTIAQSLDARDLGRMLLDNVHNGGIDLRVIPPGAMQLTLPQAAVEARESLDPRLKL
jgi:hypothetical protein